MVEGFEDDGAGAFAEHESAALGVEGTAGGGSATPIEARSLASSQRAVRRLKPVTPNGWIMECAPPPIITSASPRRRISAASPIACVLAAQAVRQFIAGPRAPVRRARCDSGMLGSCSSSRMAFMHSVATSAHLHGIDRRVRPAPRSQGGAGVGVEIERAFAGAEIDADAIEIELGGERARPPSTPGAGAHREARVAANALVLVEIGTKSSSR